MILIRESKSAKTQKQNLYGGVFTYVPLRQIQDISFTPDAEQSRRVMTIRLAGNVCLDSEFAPDNSDVEEFHQECEQALSHSVMR